MSQNAKTNNRQVLGMTRGRRRGGQPGNRNAAKPVHALSLVIADFRRRVRTAIRQVRI
jgi:hypothetical protein